ncbi:acyl--CoA ligase [Actinocrinis puniceicyclus]|uniref:Acyl--CoA ligase n=1 Tax=Actinocrinis puniceicyclus TaxID=977794 RepID=A0A8J7WTA0_9ACTN|nr:class I adenylate-forming enzyme family protein [Actinocrinis puniceicyclus]MBS2965759.1 acyl--CoA ligase [Actinocrinis puniceicyclus]
MIKIDVIRRHSETKPDAPAVIDGAVTLTWSALGELAGRGATCLSRRLADRDARTGSRDRLVFLSRNRWELPALQAAAATIGLPTVGIDFTLPPEYVAACLDQVRPAVIVASAEFRGLVAKALELTRETDWHPVVKLALDEPGDDAAGWTSWARFVAEEADERDWIKLPFEGLGFTSGTSGAPKLVLRSSSFEARRYADVVEFFGFTESDVYLNCIPLYHASGPGWARVFLTLGAPVVLSPDGDPARLLKLLEQHRVTATLMVPPVLGSLVDYAGDVVRTLPRLNLRTIITGGRHLSPQVVRRTGAAFGDVLHIYYGTTETGVNTLSARGDLSRNPQTCGRPFPGNAIAILDADDRPVPTGTCGRVAVSGYMLADGFATQAAPTVEIGGTTWWVTSDTGRLNEDGELFIASRDTPECARGVDTISLENWLKSVLDVGDLAVVIDNRGTEPRLVVAFTEGAHGSVPSGVVGAAALARLTPIQVQAVEVPAIPYSPTGKLRSGAFLNEITRPAVLTKV